MELHQVRYFVALARSMNFTRAAEQCNVTQPALTKAIQKLEYELGGPLVFRERQLTQLTDLGKLMLPMLDRSLNAVEAARSNAKEFKRKKVATLRVALTPSISASILMKPLTEVTRQIPGLQVDLVEIDSSSVFDDLLSGEIGVALASSCIGRAPERIDRWGLFDEKVLVACAADGRLAEDAEASLKDLRTARWLEPADCEIAQSFRQTYLSGGDINRTRHRGQGLHNLVSAGLGIMLAPEHMPVAPGTVVRPIAEIQFKREVELFVVAGRRYSPALDAFVKICRSMDWRARFAPDSVPRVVSKTVPFAAVARRESEQRLSASKSSVSASATELQREVDMSHHFDTPTAREDPRINVCDFYLFEGGKGNTVMALTVNPDAGLSAPDTFRDEAIYAFRFDLNGDSREELAFKIKFGAVEHADGDAHDHVQHFEVRLSTGVHALKGFEGQLIATGVTGARISGIDGVKAFAGLAPDLFAGDSEALRKFRTALLQESRFAAEAWQNRKNFFSARNVTAIVLEVPTSMIGQGRIHAWATASLYGHAPEVQVSRWGLPLITNVLIPDEAIRETYNRTGPAEDRENLAQALAQFAAQVSALAGSAPNPAEYGRQVAGLLCPVMLPYELGSDAAFGFAGFNGRGLADDVMDIIITLASNVPLADGVSPDRTRMQSDFPYFGAPFTADEQAGITPVQLRPPPVRNKS